LTCDDAMFKGALSRLGYAGCAAASVSMRPGVANTRPSQSASPVAGILADLRMTLLVSHVDG
jgi:hypothetical protein